MTPILRKLRIPLAASALAALAIATTTALAGSGVGSTFNLGETNTVDAQSVLTGNAGSAAQLKVENTGTGAALALLVSSGAPFKVNSSTKVANLNADLLDGLDSTGLPYWKLGGNAGTTPGTNFIGTTDNQALELKVNGQQALRLEPTSSGANVIGGFSANSVAAASGATVFGGGLLQGSPFPNTVSVGGSFGTVGGGLENTGGGFGGFIGAGARNTTGGIYSTVPGGFSNTAAGNTSFAAGLRAKAKHNGTFVWGDSTDADFASSAANQFLVRAAGGAKFVRGGSTFFGGSSALLAENFTTAGEAGRFVVGNASDPSPALSLVKQSGGTGNFLACFNEGGGVFASKCHINKEGTFVSGSDFAESLPVRGGKAGYQPGDVLSISRGHPGAVVRSHAARERTVVGVYSTRPAVLGADKKGMTHVGRDEIPVAITGIVPVKATAQNGPIRPGDLLTSSSLPGRAMNAGRSPAAGTVLGKALGSLLHGQGTIKVLVMLR
jgi:hypothetical protein